MLSASDLDSSRIRHTDISIGFPHVFATRTRDGAYRLSDADSATHAGGGSGGGNAGGEADASHEIWMIPDTRSGDGEGQFPTAQPA